MEASLLPASGPTSPAKPTFLGVFSKGFAKTVFAVVLFFYVTSTQHGVAGLQCSKKDFCNPIRCVSTKDALAMVAIRARSLSSHLPPPPPTDTHQRVYPRPFPTLTMPSALV
jgi:hypothetical protein